MPAWHNQTHYASRVSQEARTRRVLTNDMTDYGITMTVYCLNGYIANKNGHYRPTVSYKIQSVRDR